MKVRQWKGWDWTNKKFCLAFQCSMPIYMYNVSSSEAATVRSPYSLADPEGVGVYIGYNPPPLPLNLQNRRKPLHETTQKHKSKRKEKRATFIYNKLWYRMYTCTNCSFVVICLFTHIYNTNFYRCLPQTLLPRLFPQVPLWKILKRFSFHWTLTVVCDNF